MDQMKLRNSVVSFGTLSNIVKMLLVKKCLNVMLASTETSLT